MSKVTTRSSNASRRIALLLLLSCFAGNTFAHGGVSVEDDTCIMSIGTYRAHFTGYQPKARASQEFCEDIPVVAEAIIVLDFISKPLREMKVDFRVIRDVNNIGVAATYDDLGDVSDIEAATMFYRPPERYVRGSLDVAIDFSEQGAYIGILTAIDDKTEQTREYVSVFPFTVGVTNWWPRLKWLIVALIGGAFAFRWVTRSGDKQSSS